MGPLQVLCYQSAVFGSTSIVNNISDIVYPLFAAYLKSVFVPLRANIVSYISSKCISHLLSVRFALTAF